MNCWIDSKSIEDDFIQFKSRSMSDPPLTDSDSEIKIDWVWTTLKYSLDLPVVLVARDVARYSVIFLSWLFPSFLFLKSLLCLY